MDHMSKDPAMGNSGYARVAEDFYPTPAWMTYGAMEVFGRHFNRGFIMEPACGEGHISKVLEDLGATVYSTDLMDRGYGIHGLDFLTDHVGMPAGYHHIITNPPYGDDAQKFIEHALELTKPVNGSVMMLMRNEYDCAKGRAHLFEDCAPYAGKAVATSRPRWIEGSTGSPRHNYAWYLWDWTLEGQDPVIRYFHKPKAPTAAGNRTVN